MDVAVRAMTPSDDRNRIPQSFRRDLYDSTRYNFDTSYASDQGPGPATVETTPPRTTSRQRPRFAPNVMTKASQEKNDCLTADQTIDLFTRKIEEARNETQHALSGTEDVSDAIRPTLTIDLGRARIERLPDTIIDLIIADVERLSLSHNFLRYIPARIADCTQLRYLNIRSNDFREIPPSIYRMPLLEILDVSKNKIISIPPEIKNVENLRVFSIAHNRLTDLPVELADLSRLKVLKVAENPFRKNLKKVIHDKELEVAYSEMLENEKDTAMTTEILRYLRKSTHSTNPTAVVENGEIAEPQSAIEPSRPSRRALSGRFPVVPAAISSDPIHENSDSSNQQRKTPSLPTKSHFRGLSGQSNSGVFQKRPGIAPLISSNERNRSNSESVIQASAARQKRMGMVRRDRTELDSIDETKVVRQSHLRGLSYGSVLKRNGSLSSPGAASSSPSSPKDVRKDRSQFVRRLSSLPEHKTDLVKRPLIEGAKGILYALYQVHPHISGIISASKGRDARRSTLEMSFYNASVHVDKLNKSLEYVDNIDPEDEETWERAEETINNDCATCIRSFVHVTTQLQESTHKIIAGADPRYVRSLMLLLYGSIAEIRNAIKSFGVDMKHHRRQMSSGATHPIATIPEETTPETPEIPRPRPNHDMDGATLRQSTRFRSDTVLKLPSETNHSFQPVQPPALQIPNTTNLSGSTVQGTYSRAPSALSNTSNKSFAVRSRSNSRSTALTINGEGPNSTVPNTPRSTDSYNPPLTASLVPRVNTETGLTDAQEEQRFESIFLALTKAYEAALQAVPITMQHIQRCLEAANDQRQPKEALELWNALVAKSRTCLDLTQALQIRLTNMKFKDSGVGLSSAEGARHDPSFWTLCKSFLSSFIVLVTEMKEVRKSRMLVLPQEVVAVLRPVQKACQEAGHAITTSPWNYMLQGASVMPSPTPYAARGGEPSQSRQLNRQGNNSNSNLSAYAAAIAQQQNNQALYNHYPPSNKLQPQFPSALNSSSGPLTSTAGGSSSATSPQVAVSPVPATPLSAALGPAAQATVPSTPATSYNDSFFKGDVFQRADSLLSMPQGTGVSFLNRR